MVTHISPTMISVLYVSEHRDTSLSLRALVISIPRVYFLVIVFVLEVLTSCLSLVNYFLCYLAFV
jgi:hypothetical protein